MISRETFKRVINEIIKVNQKLDRLQDANSGIASSIVEEYSLQDELITILEKWMNLPTDEGIGSTINWWIYETEFGKNHPFVNIYDNKKRKEYCLDTIDKLYDFCLKEAKDNKKRK